MEFEWDPAKDRSNFVKHGVSFTQASLVFGDPQIMTIYDRDHSAAEDRYLSLGRTPRGQVLLVIHAYRKMGDSETIRIISARFADKGEEMVYYGEEDQK